MNQTVSMLNRIKTILHTDLFRVSFLNGVATLIRMLTGMVSVKVVAAIIGPGGIALLGQLNNFTTILISIANGGINTGVTKYVSEHSNDPDSCSSYISTGFRITFYLSILLSILLFIFAGYAAEWILLDRQYRFVFYFFSATLLIQSTGLYLIAVVNGFKEYKKYVIINISSSLIGLGFSVMLTLAFGLKGALVAAVTFQIAWLVFMLSQLSKLTWFTRKNFLSPFSRLAAGKLGHYTLMALASAITIPAAQLIIRKMIAGHEQQQLDEAGIWEAMNRVSNMYLNVITLSLSVYFLPKFAEIKDRLALRAEIRKVYKLLIPFLLLTCLTIFLLKNIVIRVLFTSAFSGMSDLFAYQLTSDFLKIMGWVLGYLMLAKAMTRTYIIMELVNFVLLTGSAYFFVNRFGAAGAIYSHILVYLNYLIVMLVVFRKMLFGKPSTPATHA